jgi:hypothetical protein
MTHFFFKLLPPRPKFALVCGLQFSSATRAFDRSL